MTCRDWFSLIQDFRPGEGTQIIRLGSKHLYSLNHTAGPKGVFIEPLFFVCPLFTLLDSSPQDID